MSLQVIRDPAELRAQVRAQRSKGKRIGLVPTMGGLHEGHLSLLREARGRCDLLIMSLFVNPTQFGPNEDLNRYPRDEEGDLKRAEECGVDLVFSPEVASMYPKGFQTSISLSELSKPLCGAGRPGHFEGVATVVTKLFHAALPDLAVFGQKDAQQLAIIRQMVLDLDFGIEIVGAPIVREEDGLAMSSRNAYLSEEERKQALSLYQGLCAARQRYDEGAKDASTLVGAARSVIGASPLAKIEYLELRDASTLQEVAEVEAPALLAVAAAFGQTRLIDNIVLG
jgi:pantoate--beta-alanine ligase